MIKGNAMTLDGHIKTGFAYGAVGLSFLLSGNYDINQETVIILFLGFVIGNVGPDLTEFGVIPHRTITHYPPLYILGVVACGSGLEFLGYQQYELGSFGNAWLTFAFAYFGGCLFHIICDIPYGGIPYFKFNRKIYIFSVSFDSVTNKVIEHAVIIAALVLIASSVLNLESINNSIGEINQSTFSLN
jgi:hypothetical protein